MPLYDFLPPCTPVNAILFSIASLCVGIVLGIILTYFFKAKGTVDKLHLFIARTSIITVWLIITIKASVFNSGDYPNWFISAMFGLVVSSLDSKLGEMALKVIDVVIKYWSVKK